MRGKTIGVLALTVALCLAALHVMRLRSTVRRTCGGPPTYRLVVNEVQMWVGVNHDSSTLIANGRVIEGSAHSGEAELQTRSGAKPVLVKGIDIPMGGSNGAGNDVDVQLIGLSKEEVSQGDVLVGCRSH